MVLFRAQILISGWKLTAIGGGVREVHAILQWLVNRVQAWTWVTATCEVLRQSTCRFMTCNFLDIKIIIIMMTLIIIILGIFKYSPLLNMTLATSNNISIPSLLSTVKLIFFSLSLLLLFLLQYTARRKAPAKTSTSLLHNEKSLFW